MNRHVPARLLVVFSILSGSGCNSVTPSQWPTPLRSSEESSARVAAANQVSGPAASAVTPRPNNRLSTEATPSISQRVVPNSLGPSKPPPPKRGEIANITLAFDQEKLPTLIQLIYGTILKKNYSLDPAIANRNDQVSFRAGPLAPSQVEVTARLLLKSYGVSVVDGGGGTLKIIPDANFKDYAPEVRRGFSDPRVPEVLRPVFQLVELQTVRNIDAAGWIRTMFAGKVNVQEDNTHNGLMLSGPPDDVAQALDALKMLDVPGMKGRHSLRINPVYLRAELLANKLSDILNTEGYGTTVLDGAGTPIPSSITLIPIKAINAVIVFSPDRDAVAHAAEWAREIDHPAAYGQETEFHTYQAQNTDAGRLADTLKEMLSQTSGGPKEVTKPGEVGLAGADPAATPQSKRIVVNPPTNSIVFRGTSREYADIRTLLEALDKPTKAAIIEVTVAEVDLKDSLALGVELSTDMLKEGAFEALTGGAGLTVKYFKPGSSSATDAIKALATANRAHILSSPRLMARNGETAEIQVGQQVPYPSSQLGSASSSSIIPGTGTLLTTVQYKDVGVILKVKPIIFSGDRIELEVSQEVSDAVSTTTGVTTAPTINTKKVETRLALKDGSTVMLGGLIADKDSFSNSGVPLLKDLPIFGPLFSQITERDERQELIILITPYTIQDDYDARSLTDAFRRQLGSWANPPRP